MEKTLYTIPELSRMGYSPSTLRQDCRIQGQTFATRRYNKRGSVWRVNLEKYERFLEERTMQQQREVRYVNY